MFLAGSGDLLQHQQSADDSVLHLLLRCWLPAYWQSVWAAGDQQARGFLIGGTSGRTTLNGEGLQREDGHSHIRSLTIPNCISYDPAYAYEVAVIMHDGLERMYGEKQENVYYYITTLNENYHMPAMPEGAEEGIRKGIYKLETIEGSKGKVQLLGSGSILRHVREAADPGERLRRRF